MHDMVVTHVPFDNCFWQDTIDQLGSFFHHGVIAEFVSDIVRRRCFLYPGLRLEGYGILQKVVMPLYT